ncbi:MAG: Ig-like domain-containing protein [Armatimonadota bacterium]
MRAKRSRQPLLSRGNRPHSHWLPLLFTLCLFGLGLLAPPAQAVTPGNVIAGDISYVCEQGNSLSTLDPGFLANVTADPGRTVTVFSHTEPANGQLTVYPGDKGGFEYTPNFGFYGIDMFEFVAQDDLGTVSGTATVYLFITHANIPPIAVDDNYSATENVTLNVPGPGVLGNDSDSNGDHVVLTKLTDPTHGTLTLRFNGSFTYVPALNYHGADSFTYQINDGHQGGTDSATVNLTVVNVPTPPNVSLTAPANDDFFLNAGTVDIPLTATASEDDYGESVSSVEFYADGGLIGTDNDGTDGWSFSWDNVASGSYALTAKAIATDGGQNTSAAVNIRVNTLPTISITAPTEGAIVPNAPATVTLTATTADSDGTVASVAFYEGANLLSTDNDGTDGWSFSWPNVAEGAYVLTAVATDNDNESTTSAAVNITVDGRPTVSITAPLGPVLANTTATTITANASDANGDTIVSVEFFIDGVSKGTDNDIAGGWSYDWTDIVPGTYVLTAKATDSDTSTEVSAPVTVRVNALPTISITDPTDNQVLANGTATYTVIATTGDTDGTVASVEFFVDGGSIGTDNDGTDGWSMAWNGITNGSYILHAVATDSDNDTQQSADIHVRVNAKPTISITDPTDNQILSNGTTSYTVVANASDDSAVISVQFFVDGGAIGADNDDTDGWSFDWTGIMPGSYILHAVATDDNSATEQSADIHVRVNALPTISITDPTDNQVLANGTATYTVVAATGDTDGTVASVEFFVDGGSIGTDNDDTDGWSMAWNGITTGSYILHAVATDSDGDTQTSTDIHVRVNDLPSISITAPTEGAIIPNAPATVTLTATTADSDGTIASVKFYEGANLLSTDNDGTDGWSFSWPNVAEGAYVLTAVATDNDNESTTSAAVNITVDGRPTVSITAPLGPVLANTTATTITANASDANGDTIVSVEFFIDGVSKGTDNDIAGGWSYDWTDIVPGTYVLTAKATDSDASTQVSAPVTVRVNALPTISITDPTDNQVLANGTVTYTVIATVGDTDGTIASVEFFVDGGSIGADIDGTDGWSIAWNGITNGSYILHAVATDSDGDTQQSADIHVRVNAKPTISITDPTDNQILSNGSTSYTVIANASDDSAVASVEFFVDGASIGTDNSSAGGWSFDWTGITPGSYILHAVVTDDNGATEQSADIHVRVNALPAISITDPTDNQVLANGTATYTVIANASDDDAVDTVEFFVDGVSIGTDIDGTDGWSMLWNGITTGSYVLHAVATDSDGATTQSADVHVRVNAKPTVAITDPTNNQVLPADTTTYTVKADAADADSTITSVQFYVDGGSIGTDIDGTDGWSADWNGIVPGTYTLNAIATDSDTATKLSAAVSVRVNALPTVSITAPLGPVLANTTATTITANAADTDGGTIASVEFFVDGVSKGTDNDIAGGWSYDWTGIVPGTYVLTAKATDSDGGIQTSAPVTVRVNALPTISITDPTDNQVLANGTATYTVIATVGDTDGTVASVEFFVDGGSIGTDNDGTDGWSMAWNGITDGSYILHAVATDSDGDTQQSADIHVRVNAKPTISITDPTDNQVLPNGTATYTVVANVSDDSAVASVEFFVDGGSIGTDNSSAGGWTIDWTGITPGSYILHAVATDDNGATEQSADIHVRVNALPTISITDPTDNQVLANGTATYTVVANTGDTDGTVASVEFFVDGGSIGTDNDDTDGWSMAWNGITTGSYILHAVATDSDGDTQTSTDIHVRVNDLPTISITAPTEGAIIPNAPATVTLTATTADSDGTVASVAFYEGANLIDMDNDGTDGWSISWTNVAEGAYALTAVATDNDNESTTSAAVNITVDGRPTVSITAPLGPVLANTTATTITANAADANGGTVVSVEFFIDGVSKGTDNDGTDGWSYDWTGIVPATYVLTAKATDNDGSTETSAPVTVRVNDLPTVAISDPTTDQVLLNGVSTYTVVATVGDSDGTINKVQFYVNGLSIGTDNDGADGWTGDWTGIITGIYTLYAVATDSDGGVTTSENVIIDVRVNILPTVAISDPVTDLVLPAGTPNYTVCAIATDDDGTVDAVQFFVEGISIGTDTDGSDGWSVVWNGIATGTYTLYAVATDSDGDTRQSADVTIDVRLNALPTVSFITPANNQVLPNSTTTFNIQANAGDIDGTVSFVEFYVNGASQGKDTDGTDGWSKDWNGITPGSYTLMVVAVDNDGGMSAPALVNVRVNAKPTISISDPVTDLVLPNGTTNYAVNATVTDTDGTVVSVQFYVDGVSIGTDNNIAGGWSANWTVVDGTHTFRAMATDNNGATTTSADVTITVRVNALPTVDICDPVTDLVLTNDANTYTVQATASDTDGTVSTVQFYVDGVSIGIDNDGADGWAANWPNIATGTYTLHAVATDNDGESQQSADVTIDVRINDKPTVAISDPIANIVLLNGVSTYTVEATASDTDGTISSVQFYVGGVSIGTDNDGTDGWTANWTGIVAGTYTLRAVATDNDGATTTSADVTITVRINAKPTVAISDPVTDLVLLNAVSTYTVQATASDTDSTVSSVQFYVDGVSIGTDNNGADGWAANWSGITTGTYTLHAVATDSDGDSQQSADVTINVRVNAKPTISITAPTEGTVVPNAPATVTITANAADSDGTVTSVKFYEGVTLIDTDTDGTDGWSINWTNVAEGAYALTAVATDNNNETTTSAVVNITVDGRPTVSITAPLGPVLANTTATTITANAADTNGGTVDSVEFFVDGNSIGTDTDDTDGWSFDWTGITTGNHALTAKATDNDGSTQISAVVNLRVNALPAVAISDPVANIALLNGVSTYTVHATATDSDGTVSSVQFYVGGVSIGTDNDGANGWTANWTGITTGTYTLHAVATDNDGDTKQSADVTIDVRINAKPTVAISDPTANLVLANGTTTYAVKATAADTDGTIAMVQFYVDGVSIGTDNSSAGGWTANWTVANGTHIFRAVATDNDGDSTTSADVTIDVRVNGLPTVAISDPIANIVLQNAVSSYTVQATASDTDGTISSVQFYVGGVSIGTDTDGANGWTANWTGITTGTYTLHAVATDNDGGTKQSADVTIDVRVNAKPTVAISDPVANIVLQNAVSSYTVQATASDTDGTIATVQFYVDGLSIGTDNSSAGGWTANWSGIAAGTHTLHAVATDNNGDSTTSADVTITVRINALPTVAISDPIANIVLPNGVSTYTVQATASDTDGTVNSVQFYVDGVSIGTDNDGANGWTANWTGITAGTYTLHAVATDNDGDTKQSADVTIDVRVNALPTVSITDPTNNQVLPNGTTTYTVVATAGDTDGTIATVQFYVDGLSIGTDNSSTGGWTANWTGIATGTHTLYAVATDNDGQTTQSATITVRKNVLPTVSITDPTNNQILPNGATTYTVVATAGDTDGTINSVQFYVDGVSIGTDNNAAGGWTGNWAGIATGTHTLYAVATDNDGQTTQSATITVRVNAKPVVSITDPTDNLVLPSTTTTYTVIASASDEDGTVASVQFYLNGISIGTDTNGADGWSLVGNGIVPGSYTLHAIATDNDGQTTQSATINVRVNAKPTVAITSPADGAEFLQPANVVIAATAADGDGTVTQVEFYIDGEKVGTDTTSPYQYSWNDVPKKATAYVLTAVATDSNGEITTSTPVNVMVNDIPPTVAITAPAEDAQFISGNEVTITATAADADGTVANVDFRVNDVSVGSDATAPYSINWTPETAGSYTLTAVATDDAGVTTTSAPVHVTVLNPDYTPDALIKLATDADYIGDSMYNDLPGQTVSATANTGVKVTYDLRFQNDANTSDSLIITGTAGDADCTVAYFYGSTDITTAVTTGGWTTPTPLQPGQSVDLQLEVTLGSAVSQNTAKPVDVTATSVADDTKTDTVEAGTTKSTMSDVTLTAVPTAPQVDGTAITLTAQATGAGTPEYRFFVSNDGGWTELQAFGTSDTCTWTPAASGTYQLRVWAREVGYSTDPAVYQVTKTIDYTVMQRLTAVALTTDPATQASINKPVELTATPTGGMNVEYRFYVYQGGAWVPLQANYSTTNTCNWTTPATPGTYQLRVYAREVGHTNDYDAIGTASFLVKATLSAVNMSASPMSPRPMGTILTLTATPVGGDNVEYQFFVSRNGGSYSPIQGYDASNVCQYTAALAGTYTFLVWAREVGSPNAQDVTRTLTFSITGPPISAVSVACSPSSSVKTGTQMTLTATATGGAWVYYRFLIYQSGRWVELRAYSDSNTYTFTKPAGTYQIMVYAREKGKTNTYDAYKLQAVTFTP